MANSILTPPFYEAPFFGKSSAYVGGRDPLGLQTTSVAAYSLLLPGITNVTERVRYWSFYCWLIQLYTEKIHKPDYNKFIQFIRRGEFLLAVAVQTLDKYESGISGQRKALRAIQDLPLDLSQYADIQVKGKLRYWQGESGAFGQYFEGVLANLGLILLQKEFRYFVCSDPGRHEKLKGNLDVSGKELALAFRDSVGPDLEHRFLQVLETGHASRADLEAFGEKMTLSAIQPGITEWRLIRKILIGRDSPGRVWREYDTFFRQNTIRLFLDFRRLEPGKRILDFPFWLEDRKGLDTDGSPSDFAFGWYYYAVNEHWHYANELILKAFLDALRMRDFSEMHSFVQEFISDILQLGGASSGQISMKHWLDYWRERDDLSEEGPDNTAKAAMGFYRILALHESYRDEIDAFIKFGRRLGIERRGDFARELRKVGEYTHLAPADFLEWYLIRHILNRHLFVAMDKLATTGVNTQKFKLEDQTLIFINNIGVGFTNPRLTELAKFLQDLKVLGHDDLPTETAGTFLTSEESDQI